MLPKALDVGPPVGQAARYAPAQEHNVVGPTSRHFGRTALAAAGRFGLFLGLERLALGLVGGDHLTGPFGGNRQIGPQPIHLLTDGMDLGQFFGCDEPVTNHTGVDELRARVAGWGNAVAAAPPSVEQASALCPGPPLDFFVREGRELAGIQLGSQIAARRLLWLGSTSRLFGG